MKFSLSVLTILAATFGVAQKEPKGGAPDGVKPPEILREATEKAKRLRFSGVRLVTSVRAGKVETHEEFITKDGNRLRIEFSPNSPFAGQIIIETGQERLHFFPDRNEVRQAPSTGRRQFDIFKMIRIGKGKPKFVVGEGGTIAGFKASKVQIQDQSGNQIGALFLDPKTGMLLKRVLFDQTGSVMASYEFSKVTLNPAIANNAFKFNRKGVKVVRPIDDLKRHAESLGLPMMGLQGKLGYVLESAAVRKIRGKDTLVQTYLKDDARLTLFVTKSEIEGEKPRGFGREFSNYRWTVNGVNCILIGSEPEEKLKALSGNVTELSR